MKYIFEIDKEGQVTLAPQVLAVKAFKDLWEDRQPDFQRAISELSMIFFFVDVRSPYMRLEEDERWKEILLDMMPDEPDWKPDEYVNACMLKYRELSRTPSMDSLESILKAQKKLDRLLDNIDLEERDMNNKPIHDPKKIQMILKDMPNLIKSLQETTRLVMTEMDEDNQLQAGRTKAEFEDAESNLG
jgi:hypothetical protein